jgi:hypothetical protein
MNTAAAPRPSDCVYVIKLHVPDPRSPGGLSGRLEHVSSGRRHDFDNGPALLACLVHEQAQVLVAAATEEPPPAWRSPEGLSGVV